MGDQLFLFNDRAMRLLVKRTGLAVRKVVAREPKQLYAAIGHRLGIP